MICNTLYAALAKVDAAILKFGVDFEFGGRTLAEWWEFVMNTITAHGC